MTKPQSKKVKLDPNFNSDNKRTTRSNSGLSQTSNSTPEPSTSKSTSKSKPTPTVYDSDNMVASDEEGGFFEYDSGVEEAEDVMIISDDEEEEEQEEQEQIETITLDSTDDEELVPPPEIVQGKMSSRKKYQLDVETLVHKYKTSSNDLIRGETSSTFSFLLICTLKLILSVHHAILYI